MSEELKLQLAERMPGVISAMAEAGGYEDQAALFKAMEKGEVKAKDVLEKFARILSERARAGGALEAAMKTSTAEQARFNNAVTDLVEVMGKNGLESGMARIFRSMREGLEESSGLGETLGKIIHRLSWIIKGMIGGLQVLGRGFTRLAESMGMSRDKLAVLAIAAGMLLLPFGKIVVAMTALLMVLDDLQRWADGRESFFKNLFEGLDEDTQKRLQELYESVKTFAGHIKDLGATIGEGWRLIFEALGDANWANAISDINALVSAINNLIEATKNLAKGDLKGAMKSFISSPSEDKPRSNLAGKETTFVDELSFLGRSLNGAIDTILPGTPMQSMSDSLNKILIERMVEDKVEKDSQWKGASDVPEVPVFKDNTITIHIDGSSSPEATAQAVRDELSRVFNVTSSNFGDYV